MFEKTASWLDQNSLTCSYRYFLGVDCPGCGLQRSMAALLRGELAESIILYPALIPLLLMMLLLVAHLVFKFKNGAIVIKYLFIINVSLISLSYISKIALYNIVH